MIKRFVSPRPFRALLAIGVSLSALAVMPAASAAPRVSAAPASASAPAALNDSGPFAAQSQASLLTVDVDALSPALLPQTNINLAPSSAQAASDQDLDAAKAGAQRSAALGGVTLGSNLLGAPLDIQSNGASAPASEVNEDTLIPVNALPLLDLPVINSRAEANWVNDVECVAGDSPLSLATQTLADVTLIEPAAGQSVVGLNTNPGEGAVDTRVSTHLAKIAGPGDARAVQARATTNISSANVLNGLAGPGSAIQADVVQTPSYVVQASGLPGGASVTGDRPVVAVTIAGQPLITLDDSNPTADAVITDLVLGDLIDLSGAALLPDLLNDLGLGALIPVVEPIEDGVQTALSELQPIVRLTIPYQETIAADGTSASVSGAILRVEVLPPAAVGATGPIADAVNQILAALGANVSDPLVEVNLGPIAASVKAPAGGIDCTPNDHDNPLRELNKHATATEVAPGGTFDYVISVPNRGPCALTDVVVTDDITGPGFEVVGTEPAATVAGGKVTFNVGDLAVNQTVNLIIHVKVAADAPAGATFDDHVVATGNCDGTPVTQDDDLNDIPKVTDDFKGPCSVQFSNKDASHEQVFEGETFSYYVHAYNTGAEPCTDVAVTDTLDQRVSFVSCSGGCEHTGQIVTWNVANIPGGSSAALAVVVKVNDGATGTLANTAIIDPGNGDPKTVTSTGPVIGADSIPKDPAAAARVISQQRLPRTGGVVPIGMALGLAGAAMGLLEVRRRATAV